MTDKEFNISPVEVEDSVLKQEEASKSLKFRPVTNDTISKKYRDWREQNRTPKEVKKDIEKAVAFSNSLPETEVDMKQAVNEHILLLTSEYVFLETGSLESAQILGNRAIKLNESMKNGVDLNAKMIMAQVNQDIRDNDIKSAKPVSEETQEDFSSMVDTEIQEDKEIDINSIPDTSEQAEIDENADLDNGDLISEEENVAENYVEEGTVEPSIDEVEVSVEDTEAPVPVEEEIEPAEAVQENEEVVEDNYEAVEETPENEVEVEEESYSDASPAEQIEDELAMAEKKLFDAHERAERERERRAKNQAERDQLQAKKEELLARLREIDEENLAKMNELISSKEEEADGLAREADEFEEEKRSLEEFNNGHEDSVANREKSWQELFEKASAEYSQAKRSK